MYQAPTVEKVQDVEYEHAALFTECDDILSVIESKIEVADEVVTSSSSKNNSLWLSKNSSASELDDERTKQSSTDDTSKISTNPSTPQLDGECAIPSPKDDNILPAAISNIKFTREFVFSRTKGALVKAAAHDSFEVDDKAVNLPEDAVISSKVKSQINFDLKEKRSQEADEILGIVQPIINKITQPHPPEKYKCDFPWEDTTVSRQKWRNYRLFKREIDNALNIQRRPRTNTDTWPNSNISEVESRILAKQETDKKPPDKGRASTWEEDVIEQLDLDEEAPLTGYENASPRRYELGVVKVIEA